MAFTIRFDPEFERLERQFRDRAGSAINSALEDGAVDLERISPRGVSPFGESLAGSWEVEPIDLMAGGDRGGIVNTAEDALRRMVGSPPGTFVDPRRGGPLFRWAQSKGIPARAVARSILARGTERWRTDENPLDIDERGELRSPDAGVTGRITSDIQRRVDQIVL